MDQKPEARFSSTRAVKVQTILERMVLIMVYTFDLLHLPHLVKPAACVVPKCSFSGPIRFLR